MGLFGSSSDRGEVLALEARLARLEEQVARLSAELARLTADVTRPEAPVDPPVLALAPELAPEVAPPVDDRFAEARALAAEGKKIHAIKSVRDHSGMGLKAAKDLVDSW
jgi:ribosomal protein L7/L12